MVLQGGTVRRISQIAALLVCLQTIGTVVLQGQQAPSANAAPVPFAFVTFGGFLGYLDGFVEYPAGPWDPGTKGTALPSGGVIGVKQWLASASSTPAAGGAKTVRLMSGNNMPWYRHPDGNGSLTATHRRHEFWNRVASLSPDVVALGVEDFARGLELDRRAGT